MRIRIGLFVAIALMAGSIGTAMGQSLVIIALACNVPPDAAPTVRSVEQSSLSVALCKAESHTAFCEAVDAIEVGMACASGLSMLLEVGGQLTLPPVNAVSREKLLVLREDDILGILSTANGVPFQRITDVIFVGQNNDQVQMLGCDVSLGAPSSMATFVQNGLEDLSEDTPCIEALQAELDHGGMWIDVFSISRGLPPRGAVPLSKLTMLNGEPVEMKSPPGNRFSGLYYIMQVTLP